MWSERLRTYDWRKKKKNHSIAWFGGGGETGRGVYVRNTSQKDIDFKKKTTFHFLCG